MDIIGQVKSYIQYVKQNPYIYEIQKQGIELFMKFLRQNPDRIKKDSLDKDLIDYFLSYWVPKNKKYLSEVQAYNIVYTVHDIVAYSHSKVSEAIEYPLILDIYGQEYVRLYKSRKLLAQLSGDPVLIAHPMVISFAAYKEYKQKKKKKDSMSMYEQGIFKVEEISKEGYLSLNKIGTTRNFRVLFRPSLLINFKEGDILHITLRRKIFFVYWEIEEIKGYYLSTAIAYF